MLPNGGGHIRKELRMADIDPESILRLGKKATEDKRYDEAHRLFTLLTREDPNNVAGWLWLAGVAQSNDERRAALERVIELEPNEEGRNHKLARKGLLAMGVTPATPSTPSAAPIPEPEPEPIPAAPPTRDLTDEELYAAELDSAYEDYDALPRAETPRRDPDATEVFSSEEAARATPRGSARERVAARGATPIHSDDDDEDLYGPPPRNRPSGLLLLLGAAIVLVLLGYLLWSLLSGRGQQTAGSGPAQTAAAQTAAAGGAGGLTGTATGEQPTGAAGGGYPAPTDVLSGTSPLTATTPLTDTGGTGEQPTTAPGEQPAPAGGGGQPPAPEANPNLQPVPIGATLEANGWTYTYPAANYSAVLGNQIGSFTANGTYVHVLVWVANNTGQDQPIPANFFALKDANNTVYTTAPQVSSAAVQRGVNADLGMEDAVPANGVLTSVYLVFDVPPGAQGLTLFAAGNNGQGWPIGITP
jgi:hypothetical protein